MKVLILSNNDAGLYKFRKELIGALFLQSHHVNISIPFGSSIKDLEQLGCLCTNTSVDRRGINPLTDFRLLLQYRSLIRREKPDFVITYTIKPNIYGGMVCRLLRVPYAVNITGLGTAFQKRGVLRTLVTVLYRMGLKRAKVVFFENEDNLRLLVRERIVSAGQTCLLPGAGVNLDEFRLLPYPEDSGATRFLFMGRVMREKGVDELFAAMERLHSEGFPCTLDVLGKYEEDYADAMARWEAAGWLRYHSYQTDVRPYIANCHCFVLPSWHEGMANTNLEAAASGRPVITSDIPGCREAVEDGVSGFLCKPQNAESLYQAMKRFLTLSQPQRQAMGQAGRKRMEAIFDKKAVVRDTIKELFS